MAASRRRLACCSAGRRMAGSKYEHVKQYELEDRLLPGTFIVIRVDGKGFTRCALPTQQQGGSREAERRCVRTSAPRRPSAPSTFMRRFSELHGFAKPNDKRALDLMDACAKVQQLTLEAGRRTLRLLAQREHTTHAGARGAAQAVMAEFADVRLAYGESDEYSFVLHRAAQLYSERTQWHACAAGVSTARTGRARPGRNACRRLPPRG